MDLDSMNIDKDNRHRDGACRISMSGCHHFAEVGASSGSQLVSLCVMRSVERSVPDTVFSVVVDTRRTHWHSVLYEPQSRPSCHI